MPAEKIKTKDDRAISRSITTKLFVKIYISWCSKLMLISAGWSIAFEVPIIVKMIFNSISLIHDE